MKPQKTLKIARKPVIETLTAEDPMVVEVDEVNGRILINAPIRPSISASGKSIVICTTNGNQPIDAQYEGNPLTAGINLYYRRPR